MSELSLRALEIAKSHIGVHEQPHGSNSGPEVNQYLASIGLNPGYFWCMAHVYFCFDQAAKELALTNPLLKTGVCKQQLLNRPENKVTQPQPGDVFILIFAHGGHCGIVEEVSPGGTSYHAVEGNSNEDGSSDGEMVCVPKWRAVKDAAGFLRF
jgi:hypothetical protein